MSTPIIVPPAAPSMWDLLPEYLARLILNNMMLSQWTDFDPGPEQSYDYLPEWEEPFHIDPYGGGIEPNYGFDVDISNPWQGLWSNFADSLY